MPLLFSYGTLQEESVQRALFGRTLSGQNDQLVGFERSFVKLENAQATTPGERYHVNVVLNGRSDSRLSGLVFEITEADFSAVDVYENFDGYRRITTTLASGKEAWVYAYAPAGPVSDGG
jgi:gamma-glutamylcyclotransferase (GGCT)/AIG2-like uncharacterized protein YtfP